MKRFLIVLGLLVIAIVRPGFYRGWFNLSTASSEQKAKVTVTMDQKKIHEDKEKAEEKVHDLERKLKEKTGK